jgi:hypothetical protein
LEGVVKHVVIAEVRQRKRTKSETNLDSVFQSNIRFHRGG